MDILMNISRVTTLFNVAKVAAQIVEECVKNVPGEKKMEYALKASQVALEALKVQATDEEMKDIIEGVVAMWNVCKKN